VRSQIILLAQEDFETTAGSVASDAATVDSTADDQDVIRCFNHRCILPRTVERSNVKLRMNDLTPGRPVQIAPAVQRLVAPNASMMTGPGTNTYLLGDPAFAVIDPGPNDASHLAAIRRVAPALELIFVTHTHSDHSSGAKALAMATGAQLIGRMPPNDGRQDESFVPDLQPHRDQCFPLACGMLRAIDTPGHASNHICYLFEDESLLFTGDHVLEGVTPVIIPPDGDMAAYLEALRRLKSYAPQAIAPGHGTVIRNPIAAIDAVIAHREKREAKVIAALKRAGRGTLDELLPFVYDDVKPELHQLARLSLEAHLIKLVQEKRCDSEGGSWLDRSSKRG
jgi:glyoxylase-like metal-dependent hydrolase (beta-lactamase superfamily II)